MRTFSALSSLWLTAMVVGCGSSPPSETPLPKASFSAAEVTKTQMVAVVEAYRRFHADTKAWPDASSTWSINTEGSFAPESLNEAHTALFVPPSGMAACDEGVIAGCWRGPYLSSEPMKAFVDGWGDPLQVFLVANADFSAANTPGGAIVVYSLGPNGIDDSRADLTELANGHGHGDDIVMVVANDVK